jgi:hypothetical protein
MELNTRATRNTVVNPEGSTVLKRNPYIQMYLEASALRLKSGDFYRDAKTKLTDFLKLGEEVDTEFEAGLAKYLADKGLKLSPVILCSILSNKGYSFRDKHFEYIFNVPPRLAEAIALQNLKLVRLNNSFKKNVLKVALENMQEHTLKKNKMKRRKVKLADLIKLLRAKPKNDKISKLYKAIIENSNEASLDVKDNMISIKSAMTDEKKEELKEEVKTKNLAVEEETKLLKDLDNMKTLSDYEKKRLIAANLEEMPINQLIRNIKFLAEKYDFAQNIDLQKRVIEKLNSVKDYRMLNIFDVIMAAMYVPQFEKALFEVVKNFINNTKREFNYSDDATVLFDVSGSMNGMNCGLFSTGPQIDTNKDGKTIGFMYLVLFTGLIKNLRLKTFSDDLIHNQDKILNEIISNIRDGNLNKAFKMFNEHFRKFTGGTSLLASANELIVNDSSIKNLVIISDEVSWKEGKNLSPNITELSKKLSNINLVLINPVVYAGTVFDKNIVAIASLNPSVLLDMAIFFDEKGFINFIRNYKKVVTVAVTVIDEPKQPRKLEPSPNLPVSDIPEAFIKQSAQKLEEIIESKPKLKAKPKVKTKTKAKTKAKVKSKPKAKTKTKTKKKK